MNGWKRFSDKRKMAKDSYFKRDSVKRFFSTGICFSFILAAMLSSLTACKKSGNGSDGAGTNGQASGVGMIPDATNPDGTRHDYVLESDPYYTCEAMTFEIPLEEGQTAKNVSIRDEVPAYFSGDRSAEDVSRIIQNRVTTLLAEQG